MKFTQGLAAVLVATAMAAGLAQAALGQAPGQTGQTTGPVPAISQPTAVAVPATPAPTPHALTADDLGAWLDGFVPYAMQRGDVAGIVVVAVKDGRILFEKGYGFADVKTRKAVDPKTTLFRPGSISKLFTWTAVMQLVEQHKLDLDADINTYLDFKIPPAFGKPVTLRNLMTHTPGFEETIRNLGTTDPKGAMSLEAFLKEWVPTRIFPPGEVSAYSNYGAALAGYIVQRASGENFEHYIDTHIFAPLDMHHASFAQPLPKALAGDMSTGYELGSGDPKKFEYINVAPAGALSVSGEDIAHFMIAHLADGAYGNTRILSAATAQQMHTTTFSPDPALPGMALGFYHEDRNGVIVIGHGGDTMYFHSDLHLIPAHNIGLYFSQNSLGKPDARIRRALFEGFMDRYFPAAPGAEPPALKSAAADGAKIAGTYEESRRSETDFLSAARLQQSRIAVDKDGILTVSDLLDLSSQPLKWREIAPFHWREVNGDRSLDAKIENGRVTAITTDQFPPILIMTPPSVWHAQSWNLPLLGFMVLMLALSALFWPIKAILRWRYQEPFVFTGRTRLAYRWSRVAALVDTAVIAGWLTFMLMGSQDLSVFGTGSDWIVIVLKTGTVIGAILTLATWWEVGEAFIDPHRRWWTKATDVLLALAATSFVWFAFSLHFIAFSLNY